MRRRRIIGPGFPYLVTPISTGAPVTYAGPGDIITGWSAWWGLRAFTAGSSSLLGTLDKDSDHTQTNFGLVSNLPDMSVVTPNLPCKMPYFVDQSKVFGSDMLLTDVIDGHTGPQVTTNAQGSRLGLTWNTATGYNYNGAFRGAPVQLTIAQPFTMYYVFKNTSPANAGVVIGNPSQSVSMGVGSSVNQCRAYSGAEGTMACTDSATHFVLAVFSGITSVMRVDGSETGADLGTSGSFSSDIIKLSANSLGGVSFEYGLRAGTMSPTDRAALWAQCQAFYGL